MQTTKSLFCSVALMVSLVGNAFAVTTSELINRDWILQTLNGIKIHLEAYPGKKPRIKFFDDLRFTAWAGCNEISGNYYFKEPDVLKFDENMIMTKMACDWPQNVENELVKTLATVQKVDITADLMQFFNVDGKAVAEYASLPLPQ